ncbi:AidA/PixA family protein [Paraburkholderia phenazinium]|uniref:AidA/PixA family protein n=1 Tax=Paraburkholderia phenazinium TaxID=60549 RepID=UPI00158B6A00|nr:AidA/PixA family protein [Paraburkholderia phenazinium]
MPDIKSTFEIVDVLTILDAEKILKSQSPLSSDSNKPTTLLNNGTGTVYMVTTKGNAISGQAGSELNISVDAGDNIRFRTLSLTDAADYKCFIHHTNVSKNKELLVPDNFTFNCLNVDEPYPAPGWPANGVSSEKRADYFWQTTAESDGQATYQFVVAIYDRHSTLKGYVTWDPYITIKGN